MGREPRCNVATAENQMRGRLVEKSVQCTLQFTATSHPSLQKGSVLGGFQRIFLSSFEQCQEAAPAITSFFSSWQQSKPLLLSVWVQKCEIVVKTVRNPTKQDGLSVKWEHCLFESFLFEIIPHLQNYLAFLKFSNPQLRWKWNTGTWA